MKSNGKTFTLGILVALLAPAPAEGQTKDELDRFHVDIGRYCAPAEGEHGVVACESSVWMRLNEARASVPHLMRGYRFLGVSVAGITLYRTAGDSVWVAAWHDEKDAATGIRFLLSSIRVNCWTRSYTSSSGYGYTEDGTLVMSSERGPTPTPAALGALLDSLCDREPEEVKP